MTIKKTQGVQTSNHLTCTWIQEVILDFKQTVKCPIGKVVIDAEKKRSINSDWSWELQDTQLLD